jgi:hypothetical protein
VVDPTWGDVERALIALALLAIPTVGGALVYFLKGLIDAEIEKRRLEMAREAAKIAVLATEENTRAAAGSITLTSGNKHDLAVAMTEHALQRTPRIGIDTLVQASVREMLAAGQDAPPKEEPPVVMMAVTPKEEKEP